MAKFLGVTPPISTSSSTPTEVASTQLLVQTLRDAGLFESEEEGMTRIAVLGKLNHLFKDFVYNISIKNNLPESIAREAGGKVFSFGSYRLGVHGKGSDIDTLCVAPKHVKRDDFFSQMLDILKSQSEVTEISAVSDAYVPVIKFVFSGIPIDLVFAQLSLPSVPENLELLDNSLLRNLDERCVRSLNGSRVTDEMLRLVPNVEAFRISLRCIKHWAKKRAIYANVFGFFGGVAWAIAVARVCQLYPNASAAVIVSKFFRIMQQWNWPQPVLLKPIDDANLGLRIWSPSTYAQDRGHRMPIITPAYPSMCATHNVTSSTQLVKLREFERAANLVDRIMIGSSSWPELFEKHDFFTRYKYYLQVLASSSTAESQLSWSGMVESRLRQLVMKLEVNNDIELAHPFIKGYDSVVDCKTEEEKHDAAHGIFVVKNSENNVNGDEQKNVLNGSVDNIAEDGAHDEENDGKNHENENSTKIYITCLYIGLSIKPKESTGGSRKLDISWPIQEFIKLVKSWDKYDETCMAIVVRHIKRSQLPLDVHEGDDPVIAKKPKRKEQPSSISKPDLTHPTNPTSPDTVPDAVNEAKRMKLIDDVGPVDESDVTPSVPMPRESINVPVVEIKAIKKQSLKPNVAGLSVTATRTTNEIKLVLD